MASLQRHVATVALGSGAFCSFFNASSEMQRIIAKNNVSSILVGGSVIYRNVSLIKVKCRVSLPVFRGKRFP